MRTHALAFLVTCLILDIGCGGTTTTPGDAGNGKDATDAKSDRAGTGGAGGSGGGSGSGGAGADAGTTPDLAPGDTKADTGDVGGSSGCVNVTECPGQDSECRHRTCIAGVCGMANEAAGKVLATQVTGDCKVRTCGADGQVTTGNDDTDKPDDLNPCTGDQCQNGTPSHSNAASGTSCGTAKMCNASGQCVGCSVAADCPGTDNDCRTRTCIQATCGFSYKAAGTKVTDPTAGDCKGLECDGQGVAQVADLSTDLPTDDNPCTLDTCNGGTPNHGPAPRNSACGGDKICDGASRCVECLTAASCPGTDSDCQTRTCTNGACGVVFATAGKVVVSQVAGDCKANQCNGQGVVVAVNDDNDTPNDNNLCTDDVCTAGVPSNPNKAAQMSCGGTLKCDGAGHCVGCLNDIDCGPSDECVTHTCNNSMCMTAYTAAGTAVATQTAQDCKKNQCDGAGNKQSVNDDGDVLIDGNPCTDDVCTAGVASNPPFPVGMGCNSAGGIKCNGNGACVACIAAIDCGADDVCTTHTCSNAGVCGRNDPVAGTDAGNQVAGDCKKRVCNGSGDITTENLDGDLPNDNNMCTADTCVAGVPTYTPTNNGLSCGNSQVCDNDGHCVGCNVPADCDTDTACRTFTCVDHMCGHVDVADGTAVPAGMQTPGDCKQVVCNGAGATRMADDNNDTPNDSKDCTTDSCASGVATFTSKLAGVACTQGGGLQCDGAGTCGAFVTLVKINEVESNGGMPGDWVELINTSATQTVDVSGWIFKDNDDTHHYAIPSTASSKIAPGAYLFIEEAGFGFGLGASDSARLFDSTGTAVIDSYTWTSHAATTYGRCPDGTGAFVVTTAPVAPQVDTKGSANLCP